MAPSGQPTQYLNPTPNSLLVVEAGSSIGLSFDFTNDAPNPQSFYLEVEGLPEAGWATGVGSSSSVVAAALGGGTIRATIAPPVRALPGDYPIVVRIICDGSVVDPPGDVTATLRVEPGPEPPEPELEQEPISTDEPASIAAEPVETPEVPVVEPKPEEPPVARTPSRPARSPRPKITAKPTGEGQAAAPDGQPDTPAQSAQPEPVPAPVPAPGKPPAAEEPVSQPEVEPRPAAPAPSPVAEPRPAAPAPTPVAEPKPAAPAAPPAQQPRPASPPVAPAATPRPAAPSPASRTAADDQMPVIDLETTRRPSGGEPDEDEDEEPEVVEQNLLDPRDGSVISLKPGESMLLRFSFRNDQRSTRTYVVDEDRSLETGWLVLVQDQVNINANGTGEVSVRLCPPPTAAPGTYPFEVRIGPLGSPLTPCNLMLEVQPTPAVQLTAKQTLVKQGPFGRSVEFELTAESAGNANTTFRVAVTDPTVETDEQGMPRGPDEVYETPQWRYLFDKEFETLRSKAAGRPPNPVSLKLRMWRKGIWWFGFKERHEARVRAVPVTDPSNGQKRANAVSLTAVRWRLLPIPGFLAAPIALLLFIFLASGASDLRVTNAYGVGRSFYVVQMRDDNWTEGKPKITLQARMKWSAPWYALLKLKVIEENRTDTHYFVRSGYADDISVEEYGDRSRRSYEVSSILRPGADPVLVRFVPLRTDMKLLLTLGPRMLPIDEYERDEVLGDEKIPLKSREVLVEVPPDEPVRINFSNLTDPKRGLKVLLWPVTNPTNFNIENFNRTDSTQIDPGATNTAKITFVGQAPQDGSVLEEDWQFVTTDATHQILHVRLRLKAE